VQSAHGDSSEARRIVNFLDVIMGPHFRVEEEALYPKLKEYFGEENVKRLLEEHSVTTETMNEFKQSIGDETYVKEDGEDVLKKLKGFFMHLTSCDGLSIIIEKFPENQKRKLAFHLAKVRAEAILLTLWRRIS
jgi:hemerythrin HHE cation binding domain-containing protein